MVANKRTEPYSTIVSREHEETMKFKRQRVHYDNYPDRNQVKLPSSSQVKETKYSNSYSPPFILPDSLSVSVWRRAARKKRNRGSAQQSRKKMRHCVADLEDKVEDLKKMYKAAMEKLETDGEMLRERRRNTMECSIVSPVFFTKQGDLDLLRPISDVESPMLRLTDVPLLPSLIYIDSSTKEEDEKGVTDVIHSTI